MRFIENGILLDEGALQFLKENKLTDPNFTGIPISSIKQHINGGAPIMNKESLFGILKKMAITLESAKIFEAGVFVKKSFNEKMTVKGINSFYEYYASRYSLLKSILLQHTELSSAVSINKFNSASVEKNVYIIGMVTTIFQSKNGNKLIEVEDPTGKITVFIKKDKNIGEERIVTDEVIGFKGSVSKNYFFCDELIWPDVPIPQQIKTLSESVSSAFISDLHFGSIDFISGIEEKFITWINSPDASNIYYLFIAGDVVDGVGVYPGQEKTLTIKDVYAQYRVFEEFVQKIPERVQVIISPGNHDAVRSAEPQPAIGKEFLPNIYEKKNVHLVGNPALVTIGAKNESCGIDRGIDVLLYHGSSFTDLVAEIPYLRLKTFKEPQHVMKEVLKKRNLAPIYGSVILSPEKKDHFVVESVPDIFVTGHLHSHAVENHKGITVISSSSFQGQTAFMDRVGHVADPGKITVIDLHTRKHSVVSIMN